MAVTAERLRAARAALMSAAEAPAADAGSEDAWRAMCSARATLRALARCAS